MNTYVAIINPDFGFGEYVYIVKAENEDSARKILKAHTYVNAHIENIEPLENVLSRIADSNCLEIGGYEED